MKNTYTFHYQILTSNGIRLDIESKVSHSEIITNLALAVHDCQRRIENPVLIEGISEIEDERENVRNDALHHLKNDIRLLCMAISARSTFDEEKILAAIVDTRNQVLQQKSATDVRRSLTNTCLTKRG